MSQLFNSIPAPFDLDPVPPKHMRLIDLTVHIPTPSSRSRTSTAHQNGTRSRWSTPEFRAYTVFAMVIVVIMAWIPIQLSLPTHPNYPIFSRRLSPGWMFGRPVDNSDAQYRGFRNNFIPLSLAALLFVVARRIRMRIHSSTSPPPDNMFLLRFNFVASMIMLLTLHGASALKIIPILSLNYWIATSYGNSMIGPVVSWVYNVGVLFLNDRYNGYKFAAIVPPLAFLDKWEGIYPRWHISFNITMLRLISFSMDYYWACKETASTPEGQLDDRQRQSVSHPPAMYSYVNYTSYALYPPLYLAGPIMTYNDYIWQHRKPLAITGQTVARYLLRFLFAMLTMEFVLHYMYVVAIKDTKAWNGDSPAQIAMIGFWNLMIVWLKLMNIWRFFRLWALAAGVDPPENMIRCMANNYSTFGFWRSWHRSYNLWIIRYIYVPAGGTNNVILNTLLVFTFVALWHDLTFRLLAWGWLASLFVVPEVIARYILPQSKYGNERWYRHVCAMGAVFNILMLMAANLVGFVLGLDGMKFFVQQLFGTGEGIQFLLGACVCLFAGSHLMFEYREDEMRNGIFRRC